MSRRALRKFTEAWAYKRLDLIDPDAFAETYALDMFNPESRPGKTTRMCIGAALALLQGKPIQVVHPFNTFNTRGTVSGRFSAAAPNWNVSHSNSVILFALRLCPRTIKGLCKHPHKELYALLEEVKKAPNYICRMSYAEGPLQKFYDHSLTRTVTIPPSFPGTK
jgi:hypothetical protein